MKDDDLWGDLPKVGKIKTPLEILKEQSNLLSEKTNGLLVGEISRRKAEDQFYYSFKLVAPPLNNYGYQLLLIQHDIGFYPLVLKNSQVEGSRTECSDEKSFKNGLRDVFTSDKTKTVINKLLTHMRSDLELVSNYESKQKSYEENGVSFITPLQARSINL